MQIERLEAQKYEICIQGLRVSGGSVSLFTRHSDDTFSLFQRYASRGLILSRTTHTHSHGGSVLQISDHHKNGSILVGVT